MESKQSGLFLSKNTKSRDQYFNYFIRKINEFNIDFVINKTNHSVINPETKSRIDFRSMDKANTREVDIQSVIYDEACYGQ